MAVQTESICLVFDLEFCSVEKWSPLKEGAKASLRVVAKASLKVF